MPLVMNGKPGMMKSMEQIYPASCCADTANSTSASFSRMAYTRLAEQTDAVMPRNRVKWCFVSLHRTKLPMPAPQKAHSISTMPPPSRKVKQPQASAAAKPSAMGEYKPWMRSISSRWLCSSSPVINFPSRSKSLTKCSSRFNREVFTPVFVRQSDWV